MAASIDFYGGEGGGTWTDLNASGVGFFGASFGTSVQVGEYQDSSFICDSDGGADNGETQLTNCKFDSPSGTIINGATSVVPSAVPINSGTLNIRFTYTDSAVKTQNCQLRIFNRTNINVGAVGVTTQVLQICNGGSGVTTSGTLLSPGTHPGWIAPSGSGTTMALLNSAGSGGLSPSGSDTQDMRHDWYVALSATPTSIGSKELFGLYVQLEYL